MERVDRFFELSSRGTTVQRELLAAVTTFATMSYILVVHPLIMSDAGMDRAQVLTITAVVAGVFSILMGLMANLPIAVAPGMGANGLVAYTLILALACPGRARWGWCSGAGVSCPHPHRHPAAAARCLPRCPAPGADGGHRSFIMFIGLKTAGIVVAAPALPWCRSAWSRHPRCCWRCPASRLSWDSWPGGCPGDHSHHHTAHRHRLFIPTATGSLT
ncbi:NCS2 family permease (plasmid) [Aminobacter sp. SR38]|nr:NCS2 family permease [Aminobacter sp. SR38]